MEVIFPLLFLPPFSLIKFNGTRAQAPTADNLSHIISYIEASSYRYRYNIIKLKVNNK